MLKKKIRAPFPVVYLPLIILFCFRFKYITERLSKFYLIKRVDLVLIEVASVIFVRASNIDIGSKSKLALLGLESWDSRKPRRKVKFS